MVFIESAEPRIAISMVGHHCFAPITNFVSVLCLHSIDDEDGR
jgi:hypothetical protein